MAELAGPEVAQALQLAVEYELSSKGQSASLRTSETNGRYQGRQS
jgi:hypothetical protein